MPESGLDQFAGQNYICLETFKKNGEGVKTPVWFVLDHGVFYVYTEANAWKVRRILNNPRVRIAVCNMRGTVKGPWLDMTASIIEGDERRSADALLTRKYFMKRIGNLFSRITGSRRAMIRIDPA